MLKIVSLITILIAGLFTGFGFCSDNSKVDLEIKTLLNPVPIDGLSVELNVLDVDLQVWAGNKSKEINALLPADYAEIKKFRPIKMVLTSGGRSDCGPYTIAD